MIQRLVVCCMLVLLLPAAAAAREVHLQAGETFRGPDLTVTCQGPSGSAPGVLALKQCQYWDEFEKRCLFQKTTLSYLGLQCTEECRHWDAYHKTCDYQSRCTFYPAQQLFVRQTCANFDAYSHKCLNVREEKISPVVKRHR